ncbi:DcrB-related protein [Pantoea sp. C2G6]|uniref:DcrB-related protein n=1 Tax=Pantoea sp. C2G6 TaxID=3243084 RepID=UPI003ED9AC33
MNNKFLCMEGSVIFDEEIRTQTVDVVAFNTGQQITINRDRLPEGLTFSDHISRQISNAEKIFNQFNFVKMEEMIGDDLFADTIEVIYTFLSAAGTGKRVWQVTYACLLSKDETINFTSLYPDEASMKKERARLQHCVKNFSLHNTIFEKKTD